MKERVLSSIMRFVDRSTGNLKSTVVFQEGSHESGGRWLYAVFVSLLGNGKLFPIVHNKFCAIGNFIAYPVVNDDSIGVVLSYGSRGGNEFYKETGCKCIAWGLKERCTGGSLLRIVEIAATGKLQKLEAIKETVETAINRVSLRNKINCFGINYISLFMWHVVNQMNRYPDAYKIADRNARNHLISLCPRLRSYLVSFEFAINIICDAESVSTIDTVINRIKYETNDLFNNAYISRECESKIYEKLDLLRADAINSFKNNTGRYQHNDSLLSSMEQISRCIVNDIDAIQASAMAW